MQDINWELVRFKYEFLGFSLEDLAKEYPVSLTVLKYNSQNWKQISLEQNELVDLENIKSIDDVLAKLSTQTINQTQAFLILKQKFLGPKYIELETTLLYKAISTASHLSDEDPKAASVLESLVEILVKLINQNPLLKSGDTSGKEGEKVWEIRIVEAKPKIKMIREEDKNAVQEDS